MSIQKKRFGRHSVILMILPVTAILGGCGSKTPEPKTPDALSPTEQQKAATSTQQGVATEAARKKAEADYMARKNNSGTTP